MASFPADVAEGHLNNSLSATELSKTRGAAIWNTSIILEDGA